jgi:hypothetical protein
MAKLVMKKINIIVQTGQRRRHVRFQCPALRTLALGILAPGKVQLHHEWRRSEEQPELFPGWRQLSQRGLPCLAYRTPAQALRTSSLAFSAAATGIGR